jgi:hypothetical protein
MDDVVATDLGSLLNSQPIFRHRLGGIVPNAGLPILRVIECQAAHYTEAAIKSCRATATCRADRRCL